MTTLQALRIFGPCDAETLADHIGDSVQTAELELWRLESHDQAMPWLDGTEVMWDLTGIGREQFTADCQRAKDEARLCQGVAS